MGSHLAAQHDLVIIVDFGSQYSRLIARRVREANVYSEILPWQEADSLLARQPKAIILSGGPNSVYDPGAPTLPSEVLQAGIPILGICYGMQLITHQLGGKVAAAAEQEYGPAQLQLLQNDIPLWKGLPATTRVWMSHGDRIDRLPPGFLALAATDNSPYAAIGDPGRRLYGLQFHPEVVHTPLGSEIIKRFLYDVSGCRSDWTTGQFIQETVDAIRQQVGEAGVICGLSGGVDSAVAARLVHEAVGDQLTAVFVDHGLLRLGEAAQVVETFGHIQGMRLQTVEASDLFLTDLAGITDPEEKRRRIGHRFINVFDAAAAEIATRSKRPVHFLVQGTLYPDVIESAGGNKSAAHTIKTHHNVGGLPEKLNFSLIEPLRYLFKDEVRKVGEVLGLPPEIVWRHPFPGPGLAIRCLGEITPERLEKLRLADAIFLEELTAAGLYRATAQAFAVLLPVHSVGVMGDARTYSEVVALRAVTSEDFMTADWARLPDDLLSRVSRRIVNEVPGVNRVVYDVTSKPPGTIEWE